MMDKIERECPVCGTRYAADPARLKHGRQTTCGRSCSYALRAGKLTNAALEACAVCGAEVRRSPSQRKAKHGSVFCSRACHYKGRSLGLTKRVVTKPYVYTEGGKAALIASASRPKGKRRWHMLTCANCGKEFDDPSDGRKRERGEAFCSLDCCNTYRRGEKNPAWRGGYRSYYGPDWRPLQRTARKRDGYACQRCAVRQRDIGRQLDVHHIQPVSSFANPNDANTLDNVVTLCHPCHMAIEWENGRR